MTTANAAAINRRVTNKRGFTIVELIVVIAIMSILLAMAFLSYKDIQQRNDVEQKVKIMYAELMNVRIRAMQRGRDHFVTLPTGSTMYRIYEDGPAPDGDSSFNTASDTLLSLQSVAPYTLVLSTATISLVQFTAKGLLSAGTPTGWVRINATTTGEYDCIFIDQIRTGMGKMNGANCIIK
jgi:prepilin-type N-terminal cleavage/methylation domain-containing protein